MYDYIVVSVHYVLKIMKENIMRMSFTYGNLTVKNKIEIK